MTNHTIDIENIGAVTEFSYNPPGPGLHVIYGAQGSGKTTILRAITQAVTGYADVKLTRTDGEKRGEARIAGRTIRITKVTREEGNLDVEGMGDLSIADLHTPPFKTPATRDRHRVVTLVKLSQAPITYDAFASVISDRERFTSLVPPEFLENKDPIDAMSRVKAAFEAEARRLEKQSQTLRSEVRALQRISEGIDLKEESDISKLQDALEGAIREAAKAESDYSETMRRKDECDKKLAEVEAARSRLAELPESDSVDLIAKVNKEEYKLISARERIASLQAQLQEHRGIELNQLREIDSLTRQLDASKRSDALRSELLKVLDKGTSERIVEDSDVEDAFDEQSAAHERITKCRAAVEQGTKVRMARKANNESDQLDAKAATIEDQAQQMRDAAKDTLRVLSDSIASIPDCPLRVLEDDDGSPRLIISTDRGSTEPFEDLSDGERWNVIMGIAARANRLIVLPQSAFGELSPSSRNALDEMAKERGCYIVTAQADDGELRARPWSNQ